MNTTSPSERKYSSWVFTWNANDLGHLHEAGEIEEQLQEMSEKYVFQLEKGEETYRQHYQGAFVTKIRVRHSTILNRFKKRFRNLTGYLTVNKMMGSWEENVAYCTKEETRVEGTEPWCSSSLRKYSGSDISLFQELDNWFPWQETIFEEIFNKDNSSFKIPKDREIIWIYDPAGNSGKSKFVKYLCSRNSDVVKVPFGTSQQIRNSMITIGPRKVYFVDIPRKLGKEDCLDSVLAVLEDLKNGFLVSAMFGKYVTLICDVPHVIVYTNMPFPNMTVSKNRWRVEQIDTATKSFIDFSVHPVIRYAEEAS